MCNLNSGRNFNSPLTEHIFIDFNRDVGEIQSNPRAEVSFTRSQGRDPLTVIMNTSHTFYGSHCMQQSCLLVFPPPCQGLQTVVYSLFAKVFTSHQQTVKRGVLSWSRLALVHGRCRVHTWCFDFGFYAQSLAHGRPDHFLGRDVKQQKVPKA